MSLRINVDNVSEFLLADGWHKVKEGTLSIDAYEFVNDDEEIFQGNEATGAEWAEEADGEPTWIAVPLSSILAVRHFSP